MTYTEDTINSVVISVIIPTYNHAEYLRSSIGSVLSQSYGKFEIIVVDDGSTDNTCEIVEWHCKPSIRYIKQQNRGLAAARNRGIGECRGDYVAFLDADDRFLPHHLQVSIDTIREHPHVGFVCGNIRTFGYPDDFYHVHNCAPSPDHYASLLKGCFIVNVGACLFRRDVLDKMGGFNEHLRASEDWDLFLRIARHFPIFCHHEVILEYRRSLGQMSRQCGLMLDTSMRTLRVQYDYAHIKEEYRTAYESGINDIIKYYGNPAVDEFVTRLRNNDLKVAWDLFLTLLRWYPKGFLRVLHGGAFRK